MAVCIGKWPKAHKSDPSVATFSGGGWSKQSKLYVGLNRTTSPNQAITSL
jgi:hypothetical protein